VYLLQLEMGMGVDYLVGARTTGEEACGRVVSIGNCEEIMILELAED